LPLKHISVVERLMPKKAESAAIASDSSTALQPCSSTASTCAPATSSENPANLSASQSQPKVAAAAPVSFGGTRKQNTLTNYVVRSTCVCHSSEAAEQHAAKMIIKDMQPFSIVTDEGFQQFVAALDPSDSLPDRKTLTRELQPNNVQRCR